MDLIREKKRGNYESSASDLPHHILQHIISLLPTKYAFRTSLVSREWAHLWKAFTKIDLEELEGPNSSEKRQRFIDFVSRLPVHCNPNLESFSLTFAVHRDGSLVGEWLRRFITPKIQELNLDLREIAEPNKIFAMVTLRSINFQNLRILTLQNVTLPRKILMRKLLSSCVSLEELSLICCDWMNVTPFVISCPLLQKVVIRESEHIGRQNRRRRCKVFLSGVNLKVFSYEGALWNEFWMDGSTTVINASIKIFLDDFHRSGREMHRAQSYLFKLLRQLSSVETLTVPDHTIEAISFKASSIGHLPVFRNLVELCVLSKFFIRLNSEALLAILGDSPFLRVLKFEGILCLPHQSCENHKLNPLPVCFRTHLKTIWINNFVGVIDETYAIQVLLNSASVLDKLHICGGISVSETTESIKDQIESFPRMSKDCKILFEF